jgi:diguanylate cyclase (GGDEF)-like protein/PAS domain S-box-containing protein
MFILQDGLFVYVNDRLAEIIGCLPEDLLGDGFWKFIHPEDQDLFRRDTMASLQKGPGPAGYELRVSRGNGEARWVEVLTTEVEYRGRLARIGNVIDITDRKHSEALAAEQTAELRRLIEQLQHLANIDGLTRVFNRRRFDEYLDREWGRLRREQKPLSLILCDVDHFKLYNDAYGHQAGDDCLRAIAKVLNLNAKRPADLVARYGGEEFGVILPDTDAEGALQVAEAIRREVLQLKIDHVGSCINDYVTVSLGVSAVVPTRRVSPNALVQLADAALYEAKNKGRDRVILKTADSVHSVTMGITPELRAG